MVGDEGISEAVRIAAWNGRREELVLVHNLGKAANGRPDSCPISQIPPMTDGVINLRALVETQLPISDSPIAGGRYHHRD